MAIIDDIIAAKTKEELKIVYLNSVKSLKILREKEKDLENDYVSIAEQLSSARSDINTALAGENTYDQIIGELRLRLGQILENDLEL